MLADDDRTVGDQGLGGSALLVDVEPGVGVHDLHLDIGVNALDAQEEGGVAGDDLGVVVGADVADLDLAVSGEAVRLGLGVSVPDSTRSLTFMPATTPET